MLALKKHARTALLYFAIAALLGCVLRFFRVFDIPITYKYVVHAHSHIALLGWVYLGLTTLLYKLYLSGAGVDKKYNKIFWFTQLTLVGMLLTFPFQGYALFSIIFSTLFLFASYWFAWFFYKHLPSRFQKAPSVKCAKAALCYLLVSSLGPWALGGIMTTLGSESVWYRLAIYFYLHFLYNGWMIMALAAVFLFILEKHRLDMGTKTFDRFFWTLNLGIVLSFFLSTLFAKPPVPCYILGGSGAALQLAAFYILVKSTRSLLGADTPIFSNFHKKLLKLVAVLWGIKMAMQLLSAIPYFAQLAVTYLDITIGYLHLTFLGVVSIALWVFLDFFGLLPIKKNFFYGYVAGFALTEVLIFYKGVASWFSLGMFSAYYPSLALVSLLILLSLLGLLAGGKKNDADT
ncbi:hypothetical protein [Pseudozobellia thermophila]|uniref:Cytochrome C and Quinol oxidase polypeptide I n=1 Tax=Pseudozobellia thermophila TaxID=192903 RepID=A0A1M6NDB3_9FLAO|nr:hypothetical protein [Pseudozobellia thermophila]SHJ93633.1 hypothetical protein SAMN04488513_11314 [Pseudozobellia thermophila]